MRTALLDNRQANQGPARAISTDIATAAWVRIARVYHRIIRRLERALDDDDLSLAQFEVLAHLHCDPGIVQNDLARRLLVSKGNVCGLIDRLTVAKLVRRHVCRDDRRANRLYLTRRGEDRVAATLPAHLTIIISLMSRLTVVELRRLHRLLERLELALATDDL